jgi:hypothetical protein
MCHHCLLLYSEYQLGVFDVLNSVKCPPAPNEMLGKFRQGFGQQFRPNWLIELAPRIGSLRLDFPGLETSGSPQCQMCRCRSWLREKAVQAT